MKLKLSLDKDSLQQFFLDHVEKIVVGLAAALGLFLVYSAVGRSGFDKTPKDLATSANNAKIAVSASKPKANDLVGSNFVEIVRRSRNAVDDQLYAFKGVFNPPISDGAGKRQTPTYLPVTELQARDGRGSLAKKRGRPAGEQWILVWGVVPLSKQIAEYRAAFEKAKHQDPKTDWPDYLGFVVERAEASNSGAAPVWEKLDLSAAQEKLKSFGSPAEEMLDKSLRPEALAWPLPPRADGKNWGDSIYPESIVGPPYSEVKEDPEGARGKKVSWMAMFDRLDGKYVIYKRKQERTGRQEYDYFAVEYASDEVAEQNQNRSLVTAIVEGSMPITLRDGRPNGQRRTVPLLKIEEPKRDPSARPGAGAPPPRSQPSETAVAAPDNVLFRFIDFDVEAGKSYIYRVSLLLRNPNYNVESRYLEKPDTARREQVQTAAVVLPQPVSVPLEVRLLAKTCSPPPPSRLDGEPTGEMLIVSWLRDRGIEAFKEFPAARGLVPDFPDCKYPEEKETKKGNKKSDTPVAAATPAADPIQVDFLTGAVVLDMRGGEVLPGKDRKAKAPAEFLIWTSQGKLQVANELDDAAEVEYRLNPSDDAFIRGKESPRPRGDINSLEGFQ